MLRNKDQGFLIITIEKQKDEKLTDKKIKEDIQARRFSSNTINNKEPSYFAIEKEARDLLIQCNCGMSEDEISCLANDVGGVSKDKRRVPVIVGYKLEGSTLYFSRLSYWNIQSKCYLTVELNVSFGCKDQRIDSIGTQYDLLVLQPKQSPQPLSPEPIVSSNEVNTSQFFNRRKITQQHNYNSSNSARNSLTNLFNC